MLHGVNAARKAENTAKKTFETGGFGIDLPEIKIKEIYLNQGIKILDLLSSNKIMSSKSEARRAIMGNAIKINNIILNDENKIIKKDDFNKQKFLKLSFGKKKHYVFKII